MLIVSSEFRSR